MVKTAEKRQDRMTWLWGNREHLVDLWPTESKELNDLLVELCDIVYKSYKILQDNDRCGAGWHWDKVYFWLEQKYQWDELFRICIDKDKSKSYLETWIAKGAYWTWILSKKKKYADYVNASKFVCIVDKLYDKLEEYFE